jgi:fatty acid desaturase
MNETVYRSAVDDWLRMTVILSTIAGLGAVVPLMLWGSFSEWLLAVPLLVVGAGFPWWILRTTEYMLSDHLLVIHSGPFRWEIPLHQIVSVTPSRSLWSSPALSLDRLRIDQRAGKSILISPENRKRFLEDLRSRGGAGPDSH